MNTDHDAAWREAHTVGLKAHDAWDRYNYPTHECVAAAVGAAILTYCHARGFPVDHIPRPRNPADEPPSATD